MSRSKVATRLSSGLSDYCMDQHGEILNVLRGTDRKPVGESFHLIPPFYTDYGLNITVGRVVFIGHGCAFTGLAAITIADEVMIAHKVNLVTAGHPVAPDIRRRYTSPDGGTDHSGGERVDRRRRDRHARSDRRS